MKGCERDTDGDGDCPNHPRGCPNGARHINHFDDYLKRYTDQGATREAAALNYVREFPARLPYLLLAMRAQFQ